MDQEYVTQFFGTNTKHVQQMLTSVRLYTGYVRFRTSFRQDKILDKLYLLQVLAPKYRVCVCVCVCACVCLHEVARRLKDLVQGCAILCSSPISCRPIFTKKGKHHTLNTTSCKWVPGLGWG